MMQVFSRFNALSRSPAQAPCPAAVAPGTSRSYCPRVKPRKPAPIVRLVPEPTRQSLHHAKALTAHVVEHVPQAAGRWVLKSDLEVVYRQLAEREGWPLLHWNRIGKELGKLCRRRQVRMTENGKRRRLAAYFIGQLSTRLAA